MSSIFLYCLIAILSYLNMLWIYGIVSNQKLKIKVIPTLILIIIAIINNVIVLRFPIGLKTIYNFVVFLFLSRLFYKNETKYWLYTSFVVWGSGLLLDMFFMSQSTIIFKKFLINYPLIRISFITIILQVIYNIIFRIKFLTNCINKLWDKIRVINNIYWIYLVVIILLIIFSLLTFLNLDVLTNKIKILFLVFICLSISIYLILYIYNEKIYRETIQNILNSNKYYSELNSKNRIFKHNIIHKLDGINSVGNEKTNKLINDLIKEYNLDNLSNSEIDKLPNGIDGLICQRVYSNKTNKISLAINNYIKSELFNVLTPRRYNKLCESLGICIDNALNATLKSKEKILQIVLLESSDNIYIKIINTFKAEIEVDKLGTINYTTNRDGHGLGLYSLLTRKDVKIQTSIINNLFENQIVIRKNKMNV